MVASRCPSSTTSRAGPVSGMSCAICLRVQVSAAPSPAGWGVMAPPTSRFDRADTHSEATLDLAEQPGSELLMRRVLFLDHFQHLIMDGVSSFRNSLSSIPHLLIGHVIAAAG